jgi:hypothetical protein
VNTEAGASFVVAGAFVVLAVFALVAAVLVRRTTARIGHGLLELDERLAGRSTTIAADLSATRGRLVAVSRADTERALWSLATFDSRLEAAEAALRERRAASDTLRASMVRNRGALVSVINSARALIRAIELRRDFLG